MTEARRSGPVFIVGAPRSGTTLVYSLLLASGDFPVYLEGETRLLQCATRYGPLTRDACFRRFMDDWMRSDQFSRSHLDPERFREGAAKHRDSYVSFLRYFMSEMCRDQDKRRWAEKTPANIHHLGRLARDFPSACFLHVIRDGRDVAISRRKLGWNVVRSDDPIRQLLGAATHWEWLVEVGRRAGARLGGRYMELHYETLLRRPEAEIPRLAEFVDADIPVSVDEQDRIEALDEGYSAFEESISGLSDAPVERWRDRLTPRERRTLDTSIGGTLSDLGYDTGEAQDGLTARFRTILLGRWYRSLFSLRSIVKKIVPIWPLMDSDILDHG